jgi:hypothetical protein
MTDPASANAARVPPRPKRRLRILRFLVLGTRDCIWLGIKNWIKILIGREPYYDWRGLFVRQYLLHLTGIRPIQKITCVGYRTEGPGSQSIGVMNAINFARCAGLTYVHTPFSFIEHADRPMAEWAAAWETLFNFGAGEPAWEIKWREAVNYIRNFPELALCLGWDLESDELRRSFNALIPEFRRKYYLNKSPRNLKEVTIAIHFRRGWDVPTNPHLLTSGGSVLQTIQIVKTALDARGVPFKISVYSEGSAADFAEVNMPGIEISKYRVGHNSDCRRDDLSEAYLAGAGSFQDIDAINAMQELIEADVLIISKSSFSYCAGYLSDGIKIHESAEGQLPLDGWLLLSKDGSLDRAAFELQLAKLISAKRKENASGSSESP